jgi:CHAD domain-containing protein
VTADEVGSVEKTATTQGAAAAEGAPIPRELELKYVVNDGARMAQWIDEHLLPGLPDLVAGAPAVVTVEDQYFDTLRGALERRGFGARLRQEDGRTLVTVKSVKRVVPSGGRGRSRALHRRIELEAVATPRLDPETWPSSSARELIDEVRGGARLHTLFTVKQKRNQRQLQAAEGTAELTLDDVRVLMGRAEVGAFVELEIESSDGSTTLLERLADLLGSCPFVTPEERSKEERARDLVASRLAHPQERPMPKPPRSPGIEPDDTLAEAGRKVLRMHLARMLACEAGTRSGPDIEELHKMRGATRRMRAAWRVFDGAYRPGLQRRYVRELRGVATALGAVRDLDVQIEGLGAYIESLPEEARPAIEPLRSDWQRQREAARGRMMAMLDSRDYRDFVDDYLDFVETTGAGELREDSGRPVLVRHTVAGRIWLAYETVRAHATTLPWADVPALHALRIDGKRLRYTLEFFAEVLPAGSPALIERVTEMQDHLGLLNDADVASQACRAWLAANASRVSADARMAVGAYLASRERELTRLRRSFPPVWRRISGVAFRRSLALAVSSV